MRTYVLVVLLATCGLTAVAVGQPTVLNGSFETALAPNWIVDHAPWVAANQRHTPALGPGNVGVHNPGSTPDGANVAKVTVGDNLGFNSWIYQTVTGFVVGQTYTLSAQFAGGYGDAQTPNPTAEAWWEVGIVPGAYNNASIDNSDPGVIAAKEQNTQGQRYQFGWRNAVKTFVATDTTYQVYLKWGAVSNYQYFGAYYDKVSIATESCTNGSSIDTVTPSQFDVPPSPGTQQLTFGGLNLNLLDDPLVVKLVQGATEIVGSVVSHDGTQIVANFNFDGYPPGIYNARAVRSDVCGDAVKNNAVELRCVAPAGSVSPPTVAIPPYPNPQSLSFLGSGLGADVVAGVRLIHPSKTMIGAITFQSSTQIDANFDMTDAPTGFYNVVFTPAGYNGGCNQETTWWEAFLIECSAPNTEVTYLVNGAGRSGDPAHKLQLGGTEVDKIDSVTLVKSQESDVATPIPGTNLQMVGSNLEATFDLTGAEGGYYDIQITRTAHVCAIVATPTLAKGFLVYMSPLANASFEEGYKADPNSWPCDTDPNPPNPGVNPKAKHWDMSRAPQTGGHKRDGTFGGPGCDPLITGLHYDGIDVSHNAASQDVAIMQAVDVSSFLDGSGFVTQDITVQADFALYGGLTPVFGYIRLLAYTDAAIGPDGVLELTYTEFLREADTGEFRSDPSYMSTIAAGTSWPQLSPAVMLIELGMIKPDTSPDSLPSAVWVDNVRMTAPVPTCNTPPQDTDGDHDVDLTDFGVFQSCFNGPNRPYGGPLNVQDKCKCLDVDPDDLDVDLTDFGKFQSCFNGPNRPAQASCL